MPRELDALPRSERDSIGCEIRRFGSLNATMNLFHRIIVAGIKLHLFFCHKELF